MERLIEFFEQHNGYVRSWELKEAKFDDKEIESLLKNELIEKITPKLYRLTYLSNEEGISLTMIDVCQAIPDAVICLASALAYYDLTTFVPSEIYIVLPANKGNPKLEYPPIKISHWEKQFYEAGIKEIKLSIGTVRIYEIEKTICDMFRYRNKLGEDLALEGLKNYLQSQKVNIHKLDNYANICKVENVMLPYIKAMLI